MGIRITETEALILGFYQSGFPTVKQLAARLGKKPNCIKQHLHNLRKKGLLTITNAVVKNEGGQVVKEVKKIRLHAQQFKIGILFAPASYRVFLRGCNELRDFERAYVRLHAQEVEVYSNAEFYGVTAEEAFQESVDYWTAFAHKLEARLGILLIKPGGRNWKVVKSGEYAHEGSALAVAAQMNGDKIAIRGSTDGKTWLLVDWSKPAKGPEHEYVHPQESKEDCHTIEDYYNDMRDRKPPTNSELAVQIMRVVELHQTTAHFQKEQSASLAAILKMMQPQEAPLMEKGKRPDYFG